MNTDAEIDQLYAATPDGFVEARKQLVKRLRAAGLRPAAGEVAALRRPSVVAWALNQVARRHPSDIDALVESGRDLRRAQRRLLSGIRGEGMRQATQRRRELIACLADRAAAVGDEHGYGALDRRELTETLERASLDEEVATVLAAGRLTKGAAPPSGFGDVLGLELAPEAVKAGGQEDGKQAAAESPQAANARRALAEAERSLSAAHDATVQARREADAAARERDDTRAEAAESQRAAAVATRRAEAAAGRAERAQDDAERAAAAERHQTDQVERARQRLMELASAAPEG